MVHVQVTSCVTSDGGHISVVSTIKLRLDVVVAIFAIDRQPAESGGEAYRTRNAASH